MSPRHFQPITRTQDGTFLLSGRAEFSEQFQKISAVLTSASGWCLIAREQREERKIMFWRIMFTNALGVTIIAVSAGIGHLFFTDGILAGALFASVFLASAGFAMFNYAIGDNLMYAHTFRSVALMALATCSWQFFSVLDAQFFYLLTTCMLLVWSFQQAFQAAVVAEKVVKHNKLSIPYGFAAWGVVGLLLGPLALIIAGLVHGQKKISADIALRTSAT
jgi:hypothetical protein